jgi:hypothetical protein
MSTGRVQLAFQSQEYVNVEEVRDTLDLIVLDWLFYINMIASWFWIPGLPVQGTVLGILASYLITMAILSMYKTMEFMGEQGEKSEIANVDVDGFMKWYLLATIVNWIMGTMVLSGTMMLLTLLPIFGGLMNWFIYEGLYVQLFQTDFLLVGQTEMM